MIRRKPLILKEKNQGLFVAPYFAPYSECKLAVPATA